MNCCDWTADCCSSSSVHLPAETGTAQTHDNHRSESTCRCFYRAGPTVHRHNTLCIHNHGNSQLCQHRVTVTFDNCRLFSLSSFAHLSTKITNQREFRLSLIFFCWAKTISDSAQRKLVTHCVTQRKWLVKSIITFKAIINSLSSNFNFSWNNALISTQRLVSSNWKR